MSFTDSMHPYLKTIYIEKKINHTLVSLNIKYTIVLVLTNCKEVRQESFTFYGNSEGKPDEINFKYIGKNKDIGLLYPKELKEDIALTERVHRFKKDEIVIDIVREDKDYKRAETHLIQKAKTADVYTSYFLETFFFNPRTALYLKSIREGYPDQVIGKSFLLAIYGDKFNFMNVTVINIEKENLKTSVGTFPAFRIDYKINLNIFQNIGAFLFSMPTKMSIWIQADKDIILKYSDEKYNYIYAGRIM